ncbi:hypothetical protein ABT264_35225 [Streptomyces virginiae]|uniref:hypothetical protein n=1 Tax=Streptomyces virginiae TaxID=1961 RepID=UPI00332FD84D
MVFIPTPDYDSDLWTGSQIDIDSPPSHCGAPLRRYEEGDGFGFECLEDDYEIHTDSAGVLTEPPFITAE